MARGYQLSRMLRLITLLEGRVGRTLDQLRAELGVTKRTVQRDLDALRAAELPLMSETRNGTVRWRFVERLRRARPRLVFPAGDDGPVLQPRSL